jgi:plastocyanin
MQSRVAAAAIAVSMALSGSWLSPSVARADVNVGVDDFSFSPQNVAIAVGETVTWSWVGGFHTTTNGADSNDPGAGSLWDVMLLPGSEPASYTFTAPGVYTYFCRFHDSLNMKGTITVGRPHAAARLKGADDEAAPTSWGAIKGIYR